MSYNFDEVDKFVEFTVFGNVYQFWYPTTEETLKMQKMSDSKVNQIIYKYIKKPEGSEYPDFKDIEKKMNVKQMAHFNKMIMTELTVG